SLFFTHDVISPIFIKAKGVLISDDFTRKANSLLSGDCITSIAPGVIVLKTFSKIDFFVIELINSVFKSSSFSPSKNLLLLLSSCISSFLDSSIILSSIELLANFSNSLKNNSKSESFLFTDSTNVSNKGLWNILRFRFLIDSLESLVAVNIIKLLATIFSFSELVKSELFLFFVKEVYSDLLR